MNDQELYNEYVNNGGSASFEGFMSVKESMPIQDFDALLGKKKEDTPASLGVDFIPQEPQNIGNPLLPTQDFPTQVAMPISNELELNPAQQQQIQQEVDTSALASPLSGENTESLSVQNTPIESSTSALPQNNPIQIKPTSTPIINTMGVKAFVPKPVVSNYKASEIIATSPTDQNGEKQIDFNTIPTQYLEATAEEKKASEDYIKENTFKDYLSNKSGKFSYRKLNQYGYSITNNDKDSIQAENDRLVALENKGLINIDTTQTDKDGRYAWSITNKDYLQTYNDYLKTISDKKDEKQEAVARYNLGGLPTLEASPLQDFARELYTKTGKVIDYADFALLSTESSRNEYLAKSIAESEVKKNPKLNYQEAYDNALKSVQPYSEQELVNGGYNLVNELIKGIDNEIYQGQNFNSKNFKESDYTDEKSFYQNALKNQDYLKNLADWWYTQGGKEQFSGNETRRSANFNSQRGRFDIFNAFEAYKQQEDFANYEVNQHLISDVRQKIKQAKENKDYSIVNLVDQFDLVADQMNNNSENAKQRGLLNDARLQSQKLVLAQEQEVAKNEADFVNSKIGTLKGHVGNILSGIVDAGKDMALGVARPINMLVGSDAADYYLDEIGKPTQIFNVKMSSMIDKVNTYQLGNKQIEERNGMFFEKVKGDLKPITLTTEDKGNLTFVDKRSYFSAKGFFGTVANQITMMAGAELAGGKILGLASKGLGRSIEAATKVYGAESKMVKGLQALNKFASNPRNNGILGWTMATIEDNYQTAKANGLKGVDLAFSTFLQSSITGLASLISPDIKFFREAKTLEEGLMVALTQKNSAMVKSLFNNFTNAIIKPALKEVPNEVAQEYVERFAQTSGEIVQSIQSRQNQFSNYSLEEFRDIALETAATVATLGLFGKMRGGNSFEYQGNTFDISKLNRKGQLALLANIYDKGVINEFRNKWGISKESADKLEAEVTTLQNYLNKIPNREQYTLEGMFGAALALQDIHNLREQRKTADETFYPKIDADIKEAQDLLTQALEESKIKNEQQTTKPTTSSEPQQEAPQDQTDPTIRENRTVAEKPTVESTTKLNLNGTTAEDTFIARNENGDIASESVITNPNTTQNENIQPQKSGATTSTTTPNQPTDGTASEVSQLGSDQQTEEEVNLDALQTDLNDLINAQQQSQNTKPNGATESQPSVISENEQRGQENPQAVSETANNTGGESDVEVGLLEKYFNNHRIVKSANIEIEGVINDIDYEIFNTDNKNTLKTGVEKLINDWYAKDELNRPLTFYNTKTKENVIIKENNKYLNRSIIKNIFLENILQNTNANVQNNVNNETETSQYTRGESDVEVKPIRTLGDGKNVYFESKKHRVNESSDGKIILNIGEKDSVYPRANIEFDTPQESVFVAKKVEKDFPNGMPDAILVDKIIDGYKQEYANLNNNQEQSETKSETQQNPNEYTRGEKTYTRQENGDFTSINKNGKPQKVTNPKTVAELNDLVDAREKENYDVEESISQNGKYKVKIVKDKTSGKAIRTELVDAKNNTVKKLTDKQTEKYVGEHIYKTEYPETVIDENLTPKEASEEVVKSSNNPKELALLISTLNPYLDVEELNPTDHAIASVIGKNVKRSSYIQFGDRNTIGNSMALSYFAPGNSGMSIDQIAQEAEVMMYGEADKQNPRITTDDVVDFMTNKFPNGKDTFYRQPNPQYLEAVQRFAEITGVNPTQNTTDVILGNKTATKVDTKKLQAEADKLSSEQQNNLEKEYNDWFNSLTLEQQYNELNLTKPQDNEHTTAIQEEQKPSTENKSVPKQSTKGSENVANKSTRKESTTKLDQATESINDFGEKIGGAKKDTYQKLENITSDDIKANPLSKIFPKPDYVALVKNGQLTVKQAFLLKTLYNAIPSKPRVAFKQRSWIWKVESAIEQYKDMLNGKLNDAAVDKMIEATKLQGGQYNLDRNFTILTKLGFPNTDVDLGTYEINNFSGHDGFSITKGHFIVKDFPTLDAAIDGLKNILDTNSSKSKTKETKFSLYQNRTTKLYFIGKRDANGDVALATFKTLDEARKFHAENKELLQEMWNNLKTTQGERSENENRQRVGTDYRKGENVSPKKFSETFGFRGVEFGNYVNNNERQTALNNAYDALMDLATILNLKPKAISLNGELGLAFGARGSGGKNSASAHYERGKVVINLTKNKGAGSLAHEWLHALDNYFERMRGRNNEFISERPAKYTNKDGVDILRPEVLEAWKNLTQIINKSDLANRSKNADKTRSKAYFGTMIEMVARSFENYIVNKLAATNEHNDYLANFKGLEEWVNNSKNLDMETYPYPKDGEEADINKAFDDLFNTIEQREDENGNIALFQRSNEDFTPLTQTAFDKLIEQLKKPFAKAFKNLNVTTDWNVFSEKAKAFGSFDDFVNYHKNPESRKGKQLVIINKTNPAPNDYNTWVRSEGDILTAEEAFNEAFNDGEMYPDFSIQEMQDALKNGKVTVYSSKPIKDGNFVTPSRMNAEMYAGGGKIYSALININDVAWIDQGEGQVAKVQFMHDSNGEIYGAKLPDGTIYINPEKLNANTAIHEFSHLWEQLMPSGWKKGVELFKQTKVGQDLFNKLKEEGNYSTLSDNELWSEALNTHVGNYGEWRHANPRSKMGQLKQWLTDTFNKLGEYFGFKLSPDTKLKNFTEGVVKDLLGGKPIVAENTTTDSDTKFNIAGEKGVLNSINKEQNSRNLVIAKEMDDKNISAEQITAVTGWYKGNDGKWRVALDFNAKLNPINFNENKEVKLSEILDYPQLFEYYPELKDSRIIISDDKFYFPNENYSAVTNMNNGTIAINKNYFNNDRRSETDKLRAIIHEVQHNIQRIEGFTGGSNQFRAEQIFNNLTTKNRGRFISDREVNQAERTLARHFGSEWLNQFNKGKISKNQIIDVLYENTYGEHEARVAEKLLTSDTKLQDLIDEQKIAEEYKYYVQDSVNYNIAGSNGVVINSDNQDQAVSSLLEARRKDKNNESAEKILLDTGWFKGKDNKWRYVMDQNLTLKNGVKDFSNETKTLQEVVDYPQLFQYYPELADMEVEFTDSKDIFPDNKTKATFDKKQNKIYINGNRATDLRGLRLSIGHEVQHTIQSIEGTSGGTNYASELRNAIEITNEVRNGTFVPSQDGRREQIFSAVYGKDWQSKVENGKLTEHNLAQLLYESNSGEVESTIVEHLLDNNPSQRLDNTLTLLGAVRERGVQYSIQNKNLIPQSTIADVVSAIKEKGNDEGLKTLQNSAWYNRQKDDVKANFNTENLLPRLMDEVKSHSKIQVERAKAKTESVKEKSKQTIAEIKAEHKTKIQEIKEKYAEKIKEVKATANLKQRDRFAKIRNIQKQAYNDLVDLVTSNSIKRSLTPTETERLIKAAAAILNTNQTEKAVQRFMDLYNKINVSELQKQYNNDVKSYAKVKDVVEQGFANGKSLDDIYADNPDIFKFDKAKQNAQRLFERLEAQANPDPNGYQKSLDRAQQLRDAMNKKLEASEVIKNIKRTWIREVSDRQFVPKHLLKNINAKATYQRMITYAGSSGAAKHAFEKINDKIFAFMTNEDNINFNQMVKLKRIIAIDTEREKRDMPYVDHEDGLNKYSAQERLDQMKEKLGEKKFAELLDKSNIYFDAFKSLLKEMHDNGFINDEQYVSMAEVDYQPRQYMQHLFDMEFDEDGKLISVDPITGESFGDYATGLSKDQIKSIQEGSKNLLMDDARLLLANAYLGRTKAKFMNRVNTTFIKKDFPKAQVKYAELTSKDPKTLTKEDKRFIKYFEELDSMVKENPIIGLKNGKPEFLYKDLPSQNWKRAYYFENGIRKEFFMKNELYEQWHDTMKKWLDSDAQNVASVMSGSALTKLMATGRNPGFALVNTPRDFGSVLLLSEEYSNFSPKAIIQLLKDSTLAIGEIWKYNNTQKDNLVSKAMEYGVAMDFLNTEGESPMVAKGLEWVYKKFFNNKGVNNKTKATSQKILDIVTLKSISNYSEMMFRIAVFDRAIQNRLKDFKVKSITDLPQQTQEDIYIDAAEKSRKVLDFNQGGRTVKSLEAVVPYINAATQGTRVLADAMTERPVDTTVRILQGGVMSAALGYGISMLLIAAFKDDDDERSAEEIYLDTKESLSKFQTRGYIHFIDGKKNENGEYTTSKIAVAQPLVPFYALVSNLYDDAIRLKLGREPKGIKYALDEFYEGAAANLDPFGVSDPAKLGTKNPIIKALVTYQSGYDFFKDQALEGTTEKLPRELEGYKSKNIQDFFKLYGEISGMSPSRTKAAVEAMLTSPDTNPFLGMTYASVDVITGYDSKFTDKKGFVKSVVGSFAKRVTAETSEFNRLQNAITAENRKTIEDAAVKEKKLDFIADYYIKEYRKDNNKDVIVKEGIPAIVNNQYISPLRKGQLIDKMTSELGKTGATSVKISSIKYDTYGSVKGKAEAILIMFGKDFTKDKEAMTQLAQAGLLTTDVMYEISQLKKSKK